MHGERLIIVDESLAIDDLIEIDYDELRLARYSIPIKLEKKFPKEINYIDGLMNKFLFFINNQESGKYFYSADWLSDNTWTKCNIKPLLEAIKEDRIKKEKDLASSQSSIKIPKQLISKALENLINITSLQGFFSISGNSFLLTAVRILLPDEIPNAVILDATAKYNVIYNLLGDLANIIDVPKNVRNYSNVTLNVFYGVPVGKLGLNKIDDSKLKEYIEQKCPSLKNEEVLEIIKKGGRGFVTLNLKRLLEYTEPHEYYKLFDLTKKLTLEDYKNYLTKELTQIDYQILVLDLIFDNDTVDIDDWFNGNIRIVFEV
jgi:hypothetical protein